MVCDRNAPEQFPIASCLNRWPGALELEHEVLAPVVEVSREGDDLSLWRGSVAGRRIADGRVPRPMRPALFLQAAAVGAFFSAWGIGLTVRDLEDAVWEIRDGTPRLWLKRTPEAWQGGPAASPVPALAALLSRLFDHGGRVAHSAARALAAQLEAPEAASRRAEFWVAGAFRCFPSLRLPAASGARERCLGFPGRALRSARSRAIAEKARALIDGRDVRIFEMGRSPLTPGAALGLDPPPASIPEACRRLREEAGQRPSSRAVWIAVAPERWDPLSLRAIDAARLALGDRLEFVTVPAALPAPEGPDEWRRALWVPCGTIAASVRFYESFAEIVSSENGQGRVRAREILSSPGWAEYVGDATGDARLPVPERFSAAPRPSLSPAGAAVSDDGRDPGARIERLLEAGDTTLALREAERWVRSSPSVRPEAWFALSARLSRESGDGFVAWLEALEAEREIAGGRPVEARARLERIARAAESSVEEKRLAKLRLAEVAVMQGDAAEAARRAALWRREHPDAPPDQIVRALRLGAAGLAREGRVDCALGLLDEAECVGVGLAVAERVETGLVRAQVHARAGRFDAEARDYDLLRPLALGTGDDRLAARYLAQEARGLLDRREYRRAIVRLEEAIALAQDDPGERAALAIDLAATLYHSGEPGRSEAALSEAAAFAAAAGREDLARIARGNRIGLLIDRCAFAEAATEIAILEASAREERSELRRLVVLHHRSRLSLRRGRLDLAARDNAEARRIAARIGDRLEIGELWLEEGDRRAYEGDREGARVAWERAAADPPDRCDHDRLARERLEELQWPAGETPPAAALAGLETLFSRDPFRGAETVARWVAVRGEAALPAELRERSVHVLRSGGAGALADRVFAGAGAGVSEKALRELRRAATSPCAAAERDCLGALAALGLSGLSVRDAEGHDLLRLGEPAPAGSEPSCRLLEGGSARLTLSLWPAIPEAAAASVAMLLETIFYRATPDPAPADFAEGWRRLGIVTADASMEEPYRRLVRFAPQPVTALIQGESGSGKEAVARAIHRLSTRGSGPFVAVNIPSIPAALLESELFGHARGAFTGAERERRGLLEEANGGTIFFDEIGDLAGPLQAKLLRSLQEREIRRVGENRARPIDARVVSATSRDLAREVEAGRFREDLYYRLHVALIRLPALRERGRDSLRLARHFLERYAREYARGSLRLAPEAAAAVATHPWPGNVRELQNAMAQAAALCDTDGLVTLALLPEGVRSARRIEAAPGDYRSRVDAHRRDLIADALDRSGGNRSRAARELGLSRQALLYLIRELKVPDRRESRS